MTAVSTRIDRTRTEIIDLLNSIQRDTRISSLTDRIHYLSFQLNNEDVRASNAIRQIVIQIENHAQECKATESFLTCLRASGKSPCKVYVCINDQLDKLALIAGKYRCAGL